MCGEYKKKNPLILKQQQQHDLWVLFWLQGSPQYLLQAGPWHEQPRLMQGEWKRRGKRRKAFRCLLSVLTVKLIAIDGTVSPPNLFVEALTPGVTVFGDGVQRM